MTDRKLSAMLSEEAYRGWQAFSEEHGVHMSALAEAIGLEMAASTGKRLTRHLAAIVKAGRQIAAERRKRRD